jgi:hypothetical protein
MKIYIKNFANQFCYGWTISDDETGNVLEIKQHTGFVTQEAVDFVSIAKVISLYIREKWLTVVLNECKVTDWVKEASFPAEMFEKQCPKMQEKIKMSVEFLEKFKEKIGEVVEIRSLELIELIK